MPQATIDIDSKPKKIFDDNWLARLHGKDVPGLNGTLDGKGDFKTWYDLPTVPSYLQQPLQILPYTILDF